LLADPRLQDGFQTEANPVEEWGERVYTELSTGTWWEETEKMEEKPEVI
jgi:hypothetical protein